MTQERGTKEELKGEGVLYPICCRGSNISYLVALYLVLSLGRGLYGKQYDVERDKKLLH